MPKRSESSWMSAFFAVRMATIIVAISGRVATRVKSPASISAPQTNSAVAASGAWNCGAGMPSSVKNATTFGRLFSLPHPDWRKIQPSVRRATVGGSQRRLLETE